MADPLGARRSPSRVGWAPTVISCAIRIRSCRVRGTAVSHTARGAPMGATITAGARQRSGCCLRAQELPDLLPLDRGLPAGLELARELRVHPSQVGVVL